ncbi:MAG: hypothetical protein IKE46_04650 [Selenomonadaceae bacterium]|nr:hypothetical protein [Selenomonadaceae bacterium]
MNEIAIIDADLIGRKNHRFPNLTCMKISGYFKSYGWFVKLKIDYDGLEKFHKVFIAKVFTDTPIPDGGIFGNPLELPNVEYGGTGFFFDKAKPLPPQIEHAMPDYHLYDEWLSGVDDGSTKFKAYRDYSIGFLTRGCFRHCSFCVNRRSNKVVAHSSLEEFLDTSRKKICLLDDNFFGYDGWKDLLLQLQATGKPFVFKQGLDVRLLDEERAEILFRSKYDGDYIFAFDDIKDAPLIEEKLQLIGRHIKLKSNRVKFYVLCGFDRSGKYDADFWERDLQGVLDRVNLLRRYDCLPYVMRHKNYSDAPPYQKVIHKVGALGKSTALVSEKDF